VLIAIPDITAGLLKRELSRPYVLQMASGKTHPLLKEALIPGAEYPGSSQSSCGFKYHMLLLGDEEEPLWCSRM
jgi:hypothetical protein